MKHNAEVLDLSKTVDWNTLNDLRLIPRLDLRAIEILKGIRNAGIEQHIASKIIHSLLYIHGGKKYASTPSNISLALQNSQVQLERQHVDGVLRFRLPIARAINSNQQASRVDSLLEGICDRFHRAGAHLSNRRKGKYSIDFSDEYDVQDVFGAIIKCCYDDVRDEEWTPSYGARAARIDFVIPVIETAAELKRARPKQAISDELILDIARYSKYPDVKKLVCFVYDPEGFLRRDATAIEADLSGKRSHNDKTLDVTVLIRPK